MEFYRRLLPKKMIESWNQEEIRWIYLELRERDTENILYIFKNWAKLH